MITAGQGTAAVTISDSHGLSAEGTSSGEAAHAFEQMLDGHGSNPHHEVVSASRPDLSDAIESKLEAVSSQFSSAISEVKAAVEALPKDGSFSPSDLLALQVRMTDVSVGLEFTSAVGKKSEDIVQRLTREQG